MTEKIKGVKALNQAIYKPLAKFGISEVFLSDEYSYIFESESITFKVTDTIEDKWFMDFIKERFNYETENFIISLLHEIGHHKANDEIEGDIYNFCTDEKERITRELENKNITAKRAKELEFQYFNLPDEIMATQWAVTYAKEHPQEIEQMWGEMLPAIQDFYAVNGLGIFL
jgi:hypothetical protein